MFWAFKAFSLSPEDLLTKEGPHSKIMCTKVRYFAFVWSSKNLLEFFIPLCQSSMPSGTEKGITESLIFQVKKRIFLPNERTESSAKGWEC